MQIRMHQRLTVWQESYSFCLWVYRISKSFPADERYELTAQVRSASASVPINIAEGNARRTHKEKRRFLDIAIGSLEETHVELLLAKDLGYVDPKNYEYANERIIRISVMLNRLHESLR